MTMSLSEALRAVFGGLFAVLLVASSVGLVMRWRVAKWAPHTMIDNLNARINAWWVMIGLIGGAIWLGRYALIILFALISMQAMREYVVMVPNRDGDRRVRLWLFWVFLPLQYGLIAIEWYGLFAILIPVYAFLLLPISATLGGDTTRFLERAAETQWGLMLCVYCISHVAALSALHIEGYEGRSVLLVVFLVLTVQSSDVFQYIWGKTLGKRKLSGAISPSKTLEGLIGGVMSATLVGAAMWWITPFTPLQAGVIALIINVMGFFGGYTLSAVKRDRGVKDWGSMIEGHGGMLDRVDSLSFSAPIFFHVVRFWWT